MSKSITKIEDECHQLIQKAVTKGEYLSPSNVNGNWMRHETKCLCALEAIAIGAGNAFSTTRGGEYEARAARALGISSKRAHSIERGFEGHSFELGYDDEKLYDLGERLRNTYA